MAMPIWNDVKQLIPKIKSFSSCIPHDFYCTRTLTVSNTIWHNFWSAIVYPPSAAHPYLTLFRWSFFSPALQSHLVLLRSLYLFPLIAHFVLLLHYALIIATPSIHMNRMTKTMYSNPPPPPPAPASPFLCIFASYLWALLSFIRFRKP